MSDHEQRADDAAEAEEDDGWKVRPEHSTPLYHQLVTVLLLSGTPHLRTTAMTDVAQVLALLVAISNASPGSSCAWLWWRVEPAVALLAAPPRRAGGGGGAGAAGRGPGCRRASSRPTASSGSTPCCRSRWASSPSSCGWSRRRRCSTRASSRTRRRSGGCPRTEQRSVVAADRPARAGRHGRGGAGDRVPGAARRWERSRRRDSDARRAEPPRKNSSGSRRRLSSALRWVTRPMPIVWSPAGCSARGRRRSRPARRRAPGRRGRPCGSTASNFSLGDALGGEDAREILAGRRAGR